MKRKEAYEIRKLIERGTTAYTLIEAAKGTVLMPHMQYNGSLIEYKAYIDWRGVTMLARAALYDTVENDPDHAPNLWATVRQRDGFRYIETSMAAELAFDFDEKGWWEGKLYKSRMQGNAYTPATAPTVWEEVII